MSMFLAATCRLLAWCSNEGHLLQHAEQFQPRQPQQLRTPIRQPTSFRTPRKAKLALSWDE